MWLHYWDSTTPLDEILRGLDDLVSQGKITHVALSDTPAWLVSRAATIAALRGLASVIAIQAEYNVAARTAERELMPMAAAMDLGVLCWAPLAAGALAGSAAPQRRTGSAIPIERRRCRRPGCGGSGGTGLPPVALGWLLHHPRWPGLIPIVGARDEAQLRETLDAVVAAAQAPAALWRKLDGLIDADPGFPHLLLASPYLRKLAAGGDAARLLMPARPRR